MKIALIALAAAAVASTAHAAPELFGITIGQRLSLPVCSAQTGDGDCYYNDDDHRPTQMSYGYSIYATHLHTAPDFAKLVGVVTDGDGAVEGFYIYTKGYEVQTVAFQTLQTKFGAPATIRTNTLLNDGGDQYDAISAAWRPEGTIISFDGVADEPGQGHILVMSPRMQDRINTAHETRLASNDF
jgi:hypothetical protein